MPDAHHHERGGNAATYNAELLRELKNRVHVDQEARRRWLSDPNREDVGRAVDAIDTDNLVWLRKLVRENGFPTAAEVGTEGVHLAWVLLQHADQDPELQRELLPILEQRYFEGELSANDLARLVDRVLVANGKPQRYGTQFDWMAGDFNLPEGGRLAEIDSERRRLGLMPLADYVCTIRSARERMR